MVQQNLAETQIAEFVLAAHNDLAKVQFLHRQNPALLNACYLKFDETALQAAGHMGERDIANYLLTAGAPLTVFAAAMLGETEAVKISTREPGSCECKGGSSHLAILSCRSQWKDRNHAAHPQLWWIYR